MVTSLLLLTVSCFPRTVFNGLTLVNTAETQFWRRGVHSEIDCSAASPAVLRQGDSSSSSQPPLQPLSFPQLVGLYVIPNAFPWPSPYMSVCPTSLSPRLVKTPVSGYRVHPRSKVISSEATVPQFHL